jgi:pheromone shutdown-related protein TraB
VDLPSSVTLLVRGDTTYYIVGTAHVSARSVDDVRRTIDAIRPDAVCVELDRTRHAALTNDNAFRDLDVTRFIREGKARYLLAQLALAAYQKRIGARLGVKPGAEMLAAIEAATAANVPVELIDRDINITLRRTWANLGAVKRTLLLASLLAGLVKRDDNPVDVEQLKEPKALSEVLAELGRAMPEIKEPLVDERDRYLMSKLLEVGAGKRKVVAVVGAAHVRGMIDSADTAIDRAALEELPPPSRTRRTLRWIISAAFVAMLAWAWQRGVGAGAMMAAWVVPTSLGAGIGTLAARGSPLAALAAMAVAPISALYPPLGDGALVGVIEASHRAPTAGDRERLPEDIQTFRGFRTNPVTRALIVSVAADIATRVGFWIGVIRLATSV